MVAIKSRHTRNEARRYGKEKRTVEEEKGGGEAEGLR